MIARLRALWTGIPARLLARIEAAEQLRCAFSNDTAGEDER